MTKIQLIILLISLPVDVFGVQLPKERKVDVEHNICHGLMEPHAGGMTAIKLLIGVSKVSA